MAKQTSILTYTGALGDTIGYRRNGRHWLRSKPKQVRQTKATQLAAMRFGMASKRGAFIRKAIYQELDVLCDTSHINRLTKLLIAANGSHPQGIKGFRFNADTGISRFFAAAPVLLADGKLAIPAQQIAKCNGIIALEVKVIATRIDCNSRTVRGCHTETMTIAAGSRFAGAMLDMNVPGHGALLLTIQVRGITRNGISADSRYLAADIAGILPPMPVKMSQRVSFPSIAAYRRQLDSYSILQHPQPMPECCLLE
ncbi:hypothetical protein [Chitinophaga rhizophila]|uniref:Uncharacterized protein n=1 Tax=Chitinophaga rhizophila TaxID=2866212 RepID=A0ABS7GIN2_9BACT|nr:hypothetical protein [Chitinophaga rhizophila]MBW8687544.1 hypothetical protein [Chitinophaga rhizophila]